MHITKYGAALASLCLAGSAAATELTGAEIVSMISGTGLCS
jgi:hypothetical protein